MMIYLVFSQEGINEAITDIMADKADLWINSDILSATQIEQLKQHNINIQFLAEFVEGSNEKAVLAALEAIERQNPKVDILVEYN